MTEQRIRIAHGYQTAVTNDGEVLITVSDGAEDRDVVIEFATVDAAEDFVHNAIRALMTLVAVELRAERMTERLAARLDGADGLDLIGDPTALADFIGDAS